MMIRKSFASERRKRVYSKELFPIIFDTQLNLGQHTITIYLGLAREKAKGGVIHLWCDKNTFKASISTICWIQISSNSVTKL